MSTERRRHPRKGKPIEGLWEGASGRCRITDISIGGRFVETLAAPAANEKTSLTVLIGSHALSLPGRVAYVVPHIGFALQFEAMPEDQERLSHLLETLE